MTHWFHSLQTLLNVVSNISFICDRFPQVFFPIFTLSYIEGRSQEGYRVVVGVP